MSRRIEFPSHSATIAWTTHFSMLFVVVKILLILFALTVHAQQNTTSTSPPPPPFGPEFDLDPVTTTYAYAYGVEATTSAGNDTDKLSDGELSACDLRPPFMYICANGQNCVAPELLLDGWADCPDGSDENSTLIDECAFTSKLNNYVCAANATCVDLEQGYACVTCRHGEYWANNTNCSSLNTTSVVGSSLSSGNNAVDAPTTTTTTDSLFFTTTSDLPDTEATTTTTFYANSLSNATTTTTTPADESETLTTPIVSLNESALLYDYAENISAPNYGFISRLLQQNDTATMIIANLTEENPLFSSNNTSTVLSNSTAFEACVNQTYTMARDELVGSSFLPCGLATCSGDMDVCDETLQRCVCQTGFVRNGSTGACLEADVFRVHLRLSRLCNELLFANFPPYLAQLDAPWTQRVSIIVCATLQVAMANSDTLSSRFLYGSCAPVAPYRPANNEGGVLATVSLAFHKPSTAAEEDGDEQKQQTSQAAREELRAVIERILRTFFARGATAPLGRHVVEVF